MGSYAAEIFLRVFVNAFGHVGMLGGTVVDMIIRSALLGVSSVECMFGGQGFVR